MVTTTTTTTAKKVEESEREFGDDYDGGDNQGYK
jgi:hypothetical protein